MTVGRLIGKVIIDRNFLATEAQRQRKKQNHHPAFPVSLWLCGFFIFTYCNDSHTIHDPPPSLIRHLPTFIRHPSSVIRHPPSVIYICTMHYVSAEDLGKSYGIKPL